MAVKQLTQNDLRKMARKKSGRGTAATALAHRAIKVLAVGDLVEINADYTQTSVPDGSIGIILRENDIYDSSYEVMSEIGIITVYSHGLTRLQSFSNLDRQIRFGIDTDASEF